MAKPASQPARCPHPRTRVRPAASAGLHVPDQQAASAPGRE